MGKSNACRLGGLYQEYAEEMQACDHGKGQLYQILILNQHYRFYIHRTVSYSNLSSIGTELTEIYPSGVVG
jgi:hypothetical protein